MTLAVEDEETGDALQRRIATRSLRPYLTDDVIGAQIGGAVKNVIAIACGAAVGAGLGESARAALMTRGFAEMVRLGVALGGRAETLGGLSGLGDLALTAASESSRNFAYGLALGRGSTPVELAADGRTYEGAATGWAGGGSGGAAGGRDAGLSGGGGAGRRWLAVPDAVEKLFNRPLRRE